VLTEVDGYLFDSEKEAARFVELRMEHWAGEINGFLFLKRDLRWPLRINGALICTYEADFAYYRRDPHTGVFSDKLVVEDCKGFQTPAYKLKRKLMKALHGIDILET
jgi:hypothetical protein